MKKETLSWIAGGTMFAAIAGVWLWQLPNIIENTVGGNDNGIGEIFSSLNAAKDSVSADLQKAQSELESNMKTVSEAVRVEETEEPKADILDDLKKKISEMPKAPDEAPAGTPLVPSIKKVE